jgi:hypothetical protein
MKITGFELQSLPTTMVIILALFVWVLSSSGVAIADTYADSAHGNPTYGVNRPDTECPTGTPCPTGDCTHCHDTFDDSLCGANPSMLFYGWIDKCNLFCYKCHGSAGGEMQVDNYLYCMNFGGRTKTWPGIYKHFCDPPCTYANCGSRHDLGAIYNLINNDPYGWGSPPIPNPCWACHNTYLAQRIESSPSYDPSKSPITRPSERYNNPSNPLWGDDNSERMDQYAASVGGYYQAPYYGSGPWDPVTGPFEPAGDSTQDGSNLPDYVNFCMDCHQYAQSDPERGGATVKVIKWGPPWCNPNEADRHGAYRANDCTDLSQYPEGSLVDPYSEQPLSNYVLSCTDCHEPHGSPYRLHLMRRFVNGQDVPGDTYPCEGQEANWQEWINLCERCHTLTHADMSYCSYCHYHGYDWEGVGGCQNLPLF